MADLVRLAGNGPAGSSEANERMRAAGQKDAKSSGKHFWFRQRKGPVGPWVFR